MGNNILKEGVNFILLRKDNSILMQLRDDGAGQNIPYPNMWAIPGGYIEPGESPIRATTREIGEELGLSVDPQDLQFVTCYDHDAIWRTHVFIYIISEEVIPKKHEGTKMEWMKMDDIKEIALAWEQERIIPAIDKFIRERRQDVLD